MYQRMWRAATSKLGNSWNESPEAIIEKALKVLDDSSMKSAARVAEAKRVLLGGGQR
jgi:hypothetical protein